MAISRIQLYLSAIISVCLASPFIFEDSIQYCIYQLENSPDKRFETNSKTIHVNFHSLKINFKLCGTFGPKDECPEGTVACLQKDGVKQGLGTNFTLENDNQLKSSSQNQSEMCSLIVHLQSNEPEQIYDKTEANCTYHLKIKLTPITITKCGITLSNHYLDLSPLNGSYNTSGDGRNFSITICGKDTTACQQNNINACQFKDGQITPLSESSSINVYVYDGHRLMFRGETHVGANGKIDKRFEVFLKCNWSKTMIQSGNLTFLKKPIQGKKFSFELETSYGCIKKPISCIINDDSYVYDLSKIYIGHPAIWRAYGPNNSEFFIQICGPADLSGRQSSCKDSYAQVCESLNGTDINRGSILSQLQLNNEGTEIRATFDTGSKCSSGKATLQYKSFIDFSCNKKDHGPEFVKYDACGAYFRWKTPHACPELDSSKCAHIQPKFPNCTFTTENRQYDLNALNTTIILSSTNNTEFKFNLCGPIDDSDTECLKDTSVIMKNLNEPNKRQRLTSLGKFHQSTMDNGDLVLKFNTGTYCSGSDYKSAIRIQCSDEEEQPVLFNNQTCYYEFLWKTPHGCSFKMENIENPTRCYFTDFENKQSINFNHLIPIEFHIDEHKLIFNVCKGLYTNCTVENNCSTAKLSTPNVTLSTNTTAVDFILQNDCSLPASFSSITFNFVCDQIKNNDHIDGFKLNDCNLKVDYFTNVVCNFQANNNEKTEKKEEPPPVKKVVDCHIKSPDSKRELDVHTLPNEYFQNECPVTSIFNQSFRYVKLLYLSNDVCRPIPTKNMSYEVYLKCSSEPDLDSKNEDCMQNFHFILPEYCDFFRAEGKSSISIIIGSVFGSLSLISLVVIGFVAWKRNICCLRRKGGEFDNIYERNAQL